MKRTSARRSVALLCMALTAAPGPLGLVTPAHAATPAAVEPDLYARRVPELDAARLTGVHRPLASQLAALDALRSNLGDTQVTARWDKSTGSLDVLYDFASAPRAGSPESAALGFLEENKALFGVSELSLRLEKNTAALGGHILYFRQTLGGLDVRGRGIGVLLDGQNRVKAVSGPYERAINVGTAPSLAAASAVDTARADLDRFATSRTAAIEAALNPAYDVLQAELGPFATPSPRLNVVPTRNGARLAWQFFLFSRNPFGLYEYQVDALDGSVLQRHDRAQYQQAPLPMTADVYPSSPKLADPDTGALALDANGEPAGLQRVTLRGTNPGANLTAVEGTLSGPHALIKNVLASRQPFVQAAAGTFHFRANNAPLEAQPNEQDDLAEPSEHIDMVNNFFFINYLLEYVDHLHRAGDLAHGGLGTGAFPDAYPNSDRPLVGLVHLPSDQGAIGASGPLDTTDADSILHSALGMDNALSFPLSQTVPGPNGDTTVVINPTAYGHGYLLNDLAKDGPAVYHEGMHSISTPIAGYDSLTPEGSAMNEGQADLWAYTITSDPVLGNYSINGHRYRAAVRANGGNPDLRQWIRNADSGLVYSHLGTYKGGFEEHRDGEIYASTVWDLRQVMDQLYAGKASPYVRPALVSGALTEKVTLSRETWERLHLGETYLMGLFEPDTFVRTRDALILADAALYPVDPTNPETPGRHRALIEQVYAARELGVNAAPPIDGRQTISTQVSDFAAAVAKPGKVLGVTVSPLSATSNRVSWTPRTGAFAYQVLRRAIGSAGKRPVAPVVGREYMDGDAVTDGYRVIDYVAGSATSYDDKGEIESSFVRRGIGNAAKWEYAVRALAVAPDGQVGLSDASNAASMPTKVLDVTSNVSVAFSNISFTPGRTQLDVTVKNNGAGAFDGTMYTPIAMTVSGISSPNVKIANADNASATKGVYYVQPTLAAGQTSQARRLVFTNPSNELFTFKVTVTARVQVPPASRTAYVPEPPPDLSNYEQKSYTATYTGIVPASDIGLQTIDGVTYVDVPFTSHDGAYVVAAKITADVQDVDLDLELLDANGAVVASAATESAEEQLTAAIKGNTSYRYRVIGWAGVAQTFSIESTETALVPKTDTSSTTTTTTTGGLGFVANPLTGLVTPKL